MNKPPTSAAVFLDRDGTLIEEKHYLRHPDQVVILPGVEAALASLQEAGFKLFIVSNQSGVGRGYFTLADVELVHGRLLRELARIRFHRIYVAPEAPGMPSRGRKPSPQFLFDARDEFGLDLTQSYIVGDKLVDIECGCSAGLKQCFLVRTGYGGRVERDSPEKLSQATVVDDLAAAARSILAQMPRIR